MPGGYWSVRAVVFRRCRGYDDRGREGMTVTSECLVSLDEVCDVMRVCLMKCLFGFGYDSGVMMLSYKGMVGVVELTMVMTTATMVTSGWQKGGTGMKRESKLSLDSIRLYR